MKITIVYQNDSHFKATRLLRAAFLFNRYQVDEIQYYELTECYINSDLMSSDVLLLSCGGRAINKIINSISIAFNKYNRRPIIVTNFPGIVVDSQFEAFITRLRSDVVLLNSKKDELVYRKICKIFKIKFNGFTIGTLWYALASDQSIKIPNQKATVFYEQDHVPKKLADRYVVADTLIRLARQNPDRHFYIKNRAEKLTNTSISTLINKQTAELPENLTVLSGDVKKAMFLSDSCITVSSSVALEALIYGQNVFLLKIGHFKDNHLEFFKNSRLLIDPANVDINLPPQVDNNWLTSNVANPHERINAFICVLLSLKKLSTQPVVTLRFNRSSMYIKLLSHFPKITLINFFKVRASFNLAIDIISGDDNV